MKRLDERDRAVDEVVDAVIQNVHTAISVNWAHHGQPLLNEHDFRLIMLNIADRCIQSAQQSLRTDRAKDALKHG